MTGVGGGLLGGGGVKLGGLCWFGAPPGPSLPKGMYWICAAIWASTKLLYVAQNTHINNNDHIYIYKTFSPAAVAQR